MSQPERYTSIDQHMTNMLRPYADARKAEISAAQLAANRANALLSTGPTTEAGKRIASFNSVKHGLTGRTTLLPSEDAEAFRHHLACFESRFAPATEPERALVQSLAETQWRLNRIPNLEAGLFLRGRLLAADKYAAHEPALAAALADAETLLTYAKDLRALHTQESRLNRTFAKDVSALATLQAERRKVEAEARPQDRPRTAVATATPNPNGSVFATHENEISDRVDGSICGRT